MSSLIPYKTLHKNKTSETLGGIRDSTLSQNQIESARTNIESARTNIESARRYEHCSQKVRTIVCSNERSNSQVDEVKLLRQVVDCAAQSTSS